MKQLYIIHWTEYDDGAQRSDGVTLHIDQKNAEDYLLKSSVGLPQLYWRGTTPKEINVTEELYKTVKATTCGRRIVPDKVFRENFLTVLAEKP